MYKPDVLDSIDFIAPAINRVLSGVRKVGDHWYWPLTRLDSESGSPRIEITIKGQRRRLSVRRLILIHAGKLDKTSGTELVGASICGENNCISPEHCEVFARGQISEKSLTEAYPCGHSRAESYVNINPSGYRVTKCRTCTNTAKRNKRAEKKLFTPSDWLVYA